MTIYEVQSRPAALLSRLTELWEASVRATHLFLTEPQLQQIKAYVPHALADVPHLVLACPAPDTPVAFMGIAGRRLEMLFLLPRERGAGLGKQLLRYAMDNYGVREVTVNEQNPQAVGFYRHACFSVYKRTDLDEAGDPYPLLYMRHP